MAANVVLLQNEYFARLKTTEPAWEDSSDSSSIAPPVTPPAYSTTPLSLLRNASMGSYNPQGQPGPNLSYPRPPHQGGYSAGHSAGYPCRLPIMTPAAATVATSVVISVGTSVAISVATWAT